MASNRILRPESSKLVTAASPGDVDAACVSVCHIGFPASCCYLMHAYATMGGVKDAVYRGSSGLHRPRFDPPAATSWRGYCETWICKDGKIQPEAERRDLPVDRR